MRNPILKPAGLVPQAGPATGEQEHSKIPSATDYKKISPKNYNRFNCSCATCHIIKDFAVEYYKNPAILTDCDKNIHIFKVIE
jgi:hypothetical protein